MSRILTKKSNANTYQITPNQTITYQCYQCSDTGFLLIGEGPQTIAQKCSCQNHRATEQKVKSARMSKLLRKCTFDRFDFRFYSKDLKDKFHTYHEMALHAREAAAGFVHSALQNETPHSLLFVGKTGRGKTYLAASIANALLERKPNTQLLFIIVPDLLNEIRSTYTNNTANEYDIIDSARSCEYLILDDLGAHNYSDWVKDKLYSIIDYRLQEQLPTIITTNLLDPASMDAVLGERITSRIFQLCKVYRLMCERDIRLVQSYEQMLNVFNHNDD